MFLVALSRPAVQYLLMFGGQGGEPRAAVRVRLVADPVSVPAARRFVRDALAEWRLPELVDDASLCVSELTANAALHSASAYFEVVLDEQPGAVRISVDDRGAVPAGAVVARGGDPSSADSPPPSLDALASTGRGLVIVSAIASDWGVEEIDSGKRVWARIAHEAPGASAPRRDEHRTTPAPPPAVLPEGWYVVRLAGCPVPLSLRQDQHLDELVRELQLIDAGEAPPQRLARVIGGLLQGQAHARHLGRRIALDAAAAGLDEIDIDMPVSAVAARQVRELHAAVLEADRLCEERELLTLASSPETVAVREWMVHEFHHQIELEDPPLSWTSWRDGRSPAAE